MDPDAALRRGPLRTGELWGTSTARRRASRAGALPPAGEPLLGTPLLRALLESAPAVAAERELCSRLCVSHAELYVSGREALRALLRVIAARSGRTEIAVAGYTCWSVAAAAEAAGLKLQLVEVTQRGQLDPSALARLPLERIAAVVVSNLFGLPEPLRPIQELCAAAGICVVDDAAQSFGALDAGGPVGGRGVPAVLSFGRGKPLCALGGGAALWPANEGGLALARGEPTPGERGSAALRAAAHDLALSRWVFPLLRRIPSLEVGVTRFDPHFARGPLRGVCAPLLRAALRGTDEALERRRAHALALAHALEPLEHWQVLLPGAGAQGAFPRLALLAPSAQARARALEELQGLGAGASALYPSALCDVPAIRGRLEPHPALPVSRDLAARILTLPTHGRLRGRRLEQAGEVLARAGAAQRAVPGTRS